MQIPRTNEQNQLNPVLILKWHLHAQVISEYTEDDSLLVNSRNDFVLKTEKGRGL